MLFLELFQLIVAFLTKSHVEFFGPIHLVVDSSSFSAIYSRGNLKLKIKAHKRKRLSYTVIENYLLLVKITYKTSAN